MVLTLHGVLGCVLLVLWIIGCWPLVARVLAVGYFVCGVLDVNGVSGLCFISSGGGVGLLCCIIVVTRVPRFFGWGGAFVLSVHNVLVVFCVFICSSGGVSAMLDVERLN